MTKKITIWVSCLCAAAVIAAGIVGWLTGSALGNNKAGVAWYDPDGKTFTITTAQELYDLAKLSRYYDFAGQTIRLGADIVFNEGTPSDWETAMPENLWETPIYGFAGTFDGQGHTISGIYGVTYLLAPLDMYYENHPTVEYWSGKYLYPPAGLFAYTKQSCRIENLNVTDSVFHNHANTGCGSIVGNGAGTLDTVYSNAVIYTSWENAGGLVGVAESGAFHLNNCWFDGEMHMEGVRGSRVGGLIGAVKSTTDPTTVEHCLSTADITDECDASEPCQGGLIGIITDGARANVTDTLSTGVLTATARRECVGTAVGKLSESGTLMTEHVYTNLDGYPAVFGSWGGTVRTYPVGLKKSCLIGNAALSWTELDFANYWTVREGDVPCLRAFANTVSKETGADKAYDVSWYDEGKTEYTLTTLDQLYGFYILSAQNTFAGKTVKLGADITINEGDAKDWADRAPENPWYPIDRFAGTFDGQGHTISGVYLHSNQPGTGLFTSISETATLKNFRLVNSYLFNDADYFCYFGSIVGCCEGTVDTVYSDAILAASGRRSVGGIVGSARGSETVTVTNCWFDGSITLIGAQASQAGGIIGNHGDTTPVRLQHCLNSGSITGGILTGGLIGLCSSSIVEISDSLNVGELPNTKHVGAATSWISSKATLSFENTYTAAESCINTVDNVQADYVGGCMQIGKDYLTGVNAYRWTMLDFDTYWAIQPAGTPILRSFAENVPDVEGVSKVMDVSWYNVREKEYVLDSPADLYGFTYLSYNTDFSRKTVKLGANISLNSGSAAAWETDAPANPWVPVYGFKGTFDGQGHTVSGLYSKVKSNDPTGMFAKTNSTIRNFRLVNSYFEKYGPYCGSVAGMFTGSMDHVYSSAIVHATEEERSRFGGLVSAVTGEAAFNECWFDGSVQAEDNRYVGGLIGSLDNGSKAISVTHCHFSGSVNGRDQVAGICGYVVDGSILLNDSLSIGTITTIGSTVGTLVGGRWSAERDIVIRNSAGVGKYDLAGTAKAKEITNSAKVNSRGRDDLKGGEGLFLATWIDFDSHWVIRDTDVPVLRSLSGSLSSLQKSMESFRSRAVLDKNGKGTYTIQNADDLTAFALLSRLTDYAGCTVKLAANVTFNKGSASGWAQAEPENEWIPVGSTSRPFAGTFDGQGHTVSGLYMNKKTDDPTGFFAQTATGAVVKNLRIENSCFAKNGPYCGSLAGVFSGTMERVYSNAIVEATGKARSRFGGLAGAVTGKTTMSECWFDGAVCAADNSYIGGLIGSLDNRAGAISVSHCLFSGTLAAKDQAGGICGYLVDGSITITDSLSIGTLQSGGASIGTLVGGRYSAARAITIVSSAGVGTQDLAGSAVAKEEIQSAKINSRTRDQLKGEDGLFLATWLDFDRHWVVRDQAVPALRSLEKKLSALQQSMEDFQARAEKGEDGKWVYTVGSPEDMKAFALLSRSMDFTNSVVKLTADLDLNPGWTASGEAPENRWTQIGSAAVPFAGTFDGQGHTISGLYASAAGNAGMFTQTASTAVLKDFRLTNSYITSSGGYAGSIAAHFAGTAERIYSNATVTATGGSAYFGGLFGETRYGDATVNECWFDGAVNAEGKQWVGGLIGGAYDAVSVSHSLFSGSITAYTGVGGVCGNTISAADITFEDTLSAGVINASQWGGLIGGRQSADSVLTANHSVSVGSAKWYGNSGASYGTGSDNVSSKTLDQLKGDGGTFLATWLDFNSHWILREGEVPAPWNMVEGFHKNYTLDEGGKRVYTIATADDLLAFAKLSGSMSFADCTVKLAADIEWNPGWTASAEAPAKAWTQIGSASVPFAGTFDGQGHTVSGVYMNTTAQYAGLFRKTAVTAILKDFRLENSYFRTTAAYGGSIAGAFAGTAEKIYSNATVHKTTSGNSRFGGLFGTVEGASASLTDCWFDGTVSAIGNSYVGGLIGSLDTSCSVTVTNCLFSGSINASNQVGGICGYAFAANSNITFTQTLAAGVISASQWGGLIAGRQTASSVLTANHSVSVGSAKWYGNSGAYSGNAVNVSSKTLDQLKGEGGAWLATWLDFENVWQTRDGAVPVLKCFASE